MMTRSASCSSTPLTVAEAAQVVDAVVTAAQQEAIDQIADDALVPASVADARVARIARICAHLGRLLSATEVEVVLESAAPDGAVDAEPLARRLPRGGGPLDEADRPRREGGHH